MGLEPKCTSKNHNPYFKLLIPRSQIAYLISIAAAHWQRFCKIYLGSDYGYACPDTI